MSCNFGSPEYYKELFSDILADIGNEPVDHEHELTYKQAMLEGFKQAVISWQQYHDERSQQYLLLQEELNQNPMWNDAD